MSSATTTQPQAPDNEYEDLLGQWLDLEAAVCTLVTHPARVHDYLEKVRLCERWLQELVAHDTDAALYLMFQLASTSTVGYSASHALVCATLCHVLAHDLALPPSERHSLVRAALTMNIGMTGLQDTLALQSEPLTPEQKHTIARHPQAAASLLVKLHVADDLWLSVVERHHQAQNDREALTLQSPLVRLIRILGTIDRYAAMISPRRFRSGRSSTESMRALLGQDMKSGDDVALALMRSVGLCPPGTFVRLDNGQIAVVLRRSSRANFPQVASLLDAQGTELVPPQLHATHEGRVQIASALARASVPLDPSHRTMARIGLYATQRTPSIGRS